MHVLGIGLGDFLSQGNSQNLGSPPELGLQHCTKVALNPGEKGTTAAVKTFRRVLIEGFFFSASSFGSKKVNFQMIS